MSQPRYTVYWQPGCTSCLKTKEFLTRHRIDFDSINVRTTPGAIERLERLGARSVPVVARGSEWTYGQDISDVARFIGVTPDQPRLPTDLLVRRIHGLLAAATRFTLALNDQSLKTFLPGRADRTSADLAWHVPMIVAGFLDAARGGLLSFEYFERRPSGTEREPRELIAMQSRMAGEFSQWWAGAAGALPGLVDTYYGRRPFESVLERTAWHIAQHVRQLEALVRVQGSEPNVPLSPEELEGLPLPDGLWDPEISAPSPRRTIGRTLRSAVDRHGSRTAVVIGTRRLSYRELLNEAEQTAAALRGIGIRPGDHVGMLMPNCIEYLTLFYGCALMGASAVHFNSRYKLDDLRYVIPHSGIRVLFTSARQREFTDIAGMLIELYPELSSWRGSSALRIDAAPSLQHLFHLHDESDRGWPGYAQFLAAARSEPPGVGADPDPEDVALIMYTSGTTNHPKACMLSHRALEHAGHAMAARFELTEQDRFWDPLPFFHMSTMLPMAACRASGACFIAREHFDPGESVREIIAERATVLFPSFPTLTNALFAHPDFSAESFDSVRVVNNVGPPDLLRRFSASLPRAIHVSAYGLTEAGGVISFGGRDDSIEERLTTGGKPFAGVEVKIVDPDTLQPLPVGEHGEILIRGPTLFSGYHADPAGTAAVMADGWLRSGDIGALTPTGLIRYLGRIKDMLKVGGENVAAIEIESYLCTHPAVKVAQVVSAADDRLVEVPAAFIELQEGASLSAAEVIRYCIGRIGSYKIPRYVYFVSEWPMSATKIQKFRLRDRINRGDYLEPAQFKAL